ncbi:MAG TPA: DUF362 domain-containing protein [Candidatus Bathyarchaeia archaeon]|nr:DUF362 domain-containing protein [Candidatus Bathyarchaeia archaeon]
MNRGFFGRIEAASLPRTISESLEWIHWTDKVKSDSTIFVKPNFTWPKFRPGVVTSPEFLSALLPILKSRAHRVIIGESDLPIFRTSAAFSGLGIDKICKLSGAEMVELSHSEFASRQVHVGGRNIRLVLPKLVLDDVDVLVNAAVPKCHVVTGVSGAMKNVYGLIPDPYRGNMYRHDINRAIVAVNKTVPSDLVVMDGLYSLAGRGPIVGLPVKTNVILAADNAVAADSIVCRMFDMDPRRIGHLKLAVKEGIGSIDPGAVQMSSSIGTIRLRPKRAIMDYFAVLTFKSRIINKTIMQSPLTPLLYQMLRPLRSPREQERYRRDIGELPKSQYKRIRD